MLSYFLPFLKVISVIHGDSDYRYKQRVRKVNLLRRKNTYFVAVSESTKKYVCAKGLKSVRVINNAIDVNFIHNHLLTRIEARQFLGVPENRYVIGTIGRLAQVKNHLFALKAFNNAYEHDQNLHMVIIGEGQQRPILEKFISDEKLGAAVTLAGAVESAFKFTRAFDLGFLSSKTEGLALALLEMLAANIPVVASDIPSFRSILPRDALFELSATACFSSMMTRPPYYKFDISLYDRSYYAKQWSDLILMESNNNV
jgi:glycosyltransferase involved in cell wall biosynthesis